MLLPLPCRRDPAAARESLRIPASRLEAARKSFGTDEDLLLITLPPALRQAAVPFRPTSGADGGGGSSSSTNTATRP